MRITFFWLVLWLRLIYEKCSDFHELSEKQHRVTQKLTRTQEFSLQRTLTHSTFLRNQVLVHKNLIVSRDYYDIELKNR